MVLTYRPGLYIFIILLLVGLLPPKVPNDSRAFFKVISCTTAGEIARALLAEGCVLPSVQKLGRVFRARDMDNLCKQEIPILRQVETYRFTIPIADDDDLGVKDFEQEIVLPHELFATLFEHHHDFCPAGLRGSQPRGVVEASRSSASRPAPPLQGR